MRNAKDALKRLAQEKQAYLAMRPRLLKKYFGKWVAIAGGQLVSFGSSPAKVLDRAYAKGVGVAYLDKVGAEDRLTIRIRRNTWPYDRTYEPFPIPRIRVTISNISRTRRRSYSDAIPDSGADVTALPITECERLGILANPVREFPISWIGQPTEVRPVYSAYVRIGAHESLAFVDAYVTRDETLIGRDVLNNFRLTLDGKRSRVTIEDC